MPYVIGAVLAIIAAYIALWAIVAAMMLFVIPALLILVALCLLGGVVFAFVATVLTLGGVGSWQSRTITPDDVVNGKARLPARRKDNTFGPDWAWPNYLAVQWRVDFEAAWRRVSQLLRARLDRFNAFARDLEMTVLWTPVLVFPYGCLLAVTVGALAGALAVVVLAGVVLVPAWLVLLSMIGVLRSVDLVVRRFRKASASCPACYYVTPLPAYSCDRCDRVHRDVRPGWLGVVSRRCGCGRKLPTMVLRAAWRLKAQCVSCEQPLRSGAAVLTDLRLPVFGPVSAGKTRLVYAALVELHDRLAALGGRLEFDDDKSRRSFEDGAVIIESGESTQKTPAGNLPEPITVRITLARRRALLHLFDAAGEFYVDREDNSDLAFLDHAQGLVFVVDPFSVRWVTDQLTGARTSRLRAANPASGDPEHVYHVTARRLRDYGVDTRRRHLAMTVVKSDLLIDLPLADDLRAGDVRGWLDRAGLDNLVLSAERDFARVSYHAVASVARGHGAATLSAADPFLWLLGETGFLPSNSDLGDQPARAG